MNDPLVCPACGAQDRIVEHAAAYLMSDELARAGLPVPISE
ncbi:hypothetical protein GCM10022226_55720 [Sphaerisporangium flaviroseum]|uniref:Uncharacterized protein n=1 Tax=Sphaerisporangium flaviroseum TaxID=509199 RepID=A0ABP7IV05_9ACTN